MLFEDCNFKIYTFKEVNFMSALEIEECKLHVYDNEKSVYWITPNLNV